MRVFREEIRPATILAIIFCAFMVLGGCAPVSRYSYDPAADFRALKTYAWAPGSLAAPENILIEKNVRYYADQILRKRGFAATSDNPDFVMSMSYESEYGSPYKLAKLYLYAARAQGKDLIWQGWAKSKITDIRADAASPELAEAVNKILANFPPKR